MYKLMNIMKRNCGTAFLSAVLMAGGFLLTGCTNSDYDFNQVDGTMGFGGELTLPTSTTMNIPLKDILKLKEGGVVQIDPVDSSYVFYKSGEQTSPAHPYIDKIVITKSQSSSQNITLSLSGAATRAAATRATTTTPLKGEGDVFTFRYAGDKPASVESLSHATISGYMRLEADLTGISSLTSKLDKVVLTFPDYMEVYQDDVKGNVITLTDVPTDEPLVVFVQVEGLDFTKTGTGLAVSDQNITMNGTVQMSIETSTYNTSATSTSGTIRNTLEMSDITVVNATGRFNPSINLADLGRVSITGVPDFLSGDNVKVDLYNPIIKLQVTSDMPIGGVLGGTLTSTKSGSTTASVSFDGINIAAEHTTYACICRSTDPDRLSRVPESAQLVEVPNLSTIIEKIPDYITFTGIARADASKEGTFELGHEYIVGASYYVEAPISFAENAVIEYSDSFDGWNKDLKDIKLADGTYISLTATAQNKLPLALVIEATPLDANGKDISSDIEINIKQGTAKASIDGVNAAESPLEIEIREKTKGALQKLDGLSYKFLGKATQEDVSVTGIPLNAKDHTLKLNDIKVKVVGQVIAEL